MAKMIPPEPPADERGQQAERSAYLEFRDQLPDEFTVFWGLELLTEDAAEAEIDFLIAHRELGLLVVECKGGGVERNEHGTWVRHHQGAVDSLKRSPWEQARDQMWKLVDELKRRGSELSSALGRKIRKHGLPIAHGYAACFPFATEESANVPVGSDEKICFDSEDFETGLESRVREALQFWNAKRNKPGLSEEEFRAFERRVLYPRVSIAENLNARIDAEDRVFERLSDEQCTVIRSLADEGRVLVEGGAGTGKSLLALEAARVLADDDNRVLLTCFNRKLRDSLGSTIRSDEEGAGRIDVAHFHGLCRQAFDALGGEVDYPDGEDKEAARAFWNDEAPMALFEALEAGEIGPWDAMVVDEAQDFAGDWWEILESGLRDGREGRLVAMHDPTQDLFDRSGKLPEFDVKHPLTWNFRNTTEICEVCDALYPGELRSHPRTPQGVPPEVQRYDSRETEFRAMERLIDRLVNDEGLGPEHLVVLTPRTKPHSVLADHDEIAGLRITRYLEEADDKLLHSSIGGFKGLERDVVIFADVDPDYPRCSRNARYVAASRAANRLFVFEKSDWLADT